MLEGILYCTVALFVIIDPFASVPLFHIVSSEYPGGAKRLAWEASLYTFIILVVFSFLGGPLFDYLGVSMESLKIAGGVLLFSIALGLMKEGEKPFRRMSPPELEGFGVVPLATPMLAGPGAISTTIILSKEFPLYVVILSLLIQSLLIFVILYFSSAITRILGEKGSRAMTRILGLITASIAVQFMVDGLKGIIQSS